jgi:phosphoglycolate phosphatase-like HAD superfamily hydrolase
MTPTVPRGLVIFDIDGTLFETDTATIPAVQKSFAEFELEPPTFEEVTAFMGRPDEETHRWLEQRVGDVWRDLARAMGANEMAMVGLTGRLYPGVPELLAELRARAMQLGICSNGPEDYVTTVLETKELAHFFAAVRWRRDGDTSKTEMVRDLLDTLPARPAALVGDRQDDVEAAHANGLAVIGTSYGYGRAGELEAADLQVAAPADLLAAIDSILGRRPG